MDKQMVLDKLVKDTKEGKVIWHKESPDVYEATLDGIGFTLYAGDNYQLYLSAAESPTRTRFIDLVGLAPLVDIVELHTSPAFSKLKAWINA
jgi:hypothetical protein